MKRSSPLLALLFSGLTACSGGAHDDHGHEHGEDEHPASPASGEGAHAHEDEHLSEVSLLVEAQKRANIDVIQVVREPLLGGISVPGEVTFDPSSTAHIGPLVSGRITRVNVQLGENVKKGQVLGSVASSDVSSARSQLAQSRARYSAAETALKRQQQLASEGIGAQRALIDAEARVAELKAEVRGYQSQLAVLGSSGSGELSLSAPIDGVVVALQGSLGEPAGPSQAVFVVTDPTRVWVKGNVPELEIGRVSLNDQVLVRLHAFPSKAMPGRITYVAPALDTQTRSLPIQVTLSSPDPRLKSGLFGSIELIGGNDEEPPITVPENAVATIKGQTVVFSPTQDPSKFTPVPVTIGRTANKRVEILSGLHEQDKIVGSGAFILKSILLSDELGDGHAH